MRNFVKTPLWPLQNQFLCAVGALTSLLTLREKAKGLPYKMNVINGAVEALPRLLHASWNQIMFLGFGFR